MSWSGPVSLLSGLPSGVRHVRWLLRYADPRVAMIWFSWAASLFGAFVLFEDVVRAVVPGMPYEHQIYDAFGLLPGWVVGSAFVVGAFALVWGVAGEVRRVVQGAAVLLLAAWVYTFVMLPLASLVQGTFLPTAFARYAAPIPVAWWVYARAAYKGGFLGPGVLPRHRRPAVTTGFAAVVCVPALGFAFADVIVGAQVGPGTGHIPEAVWALAGTVVTALLVYFGQRYAKRTDLSGQSLAETLEHNRFMMGLLNEQAGSREREIDHVRGQLSLVLPVRDVQDAWCRNHCPAFADRPTGLPSATGP